MNDFTVLRIGWKYGNSLELYRWQVIIHWQ
jgi:hypothetical protein